MGFDRSKLVDYLDGRLPKEEAERIREIVSLDLELQIELEHLEKSGGALEGAFSWIRDEEPPAEIVDLVRRNSKRTTMGLRSTTNINWLSIAASVAIGMFAGGVTLQAFTTYTEPDGVLSLEGANRSEDLQFRSRGSSDAPAGDNEAIIQDIFEDRRDGEAFITRTQTGARIEAKVLRSYFAENGSICRTAEVLRVEQGIRAEMSACLSNDGGWRITSVEAVK